MSVTADNGCGISAAESEAVTVNVAGIFWTAGGGNSDWNNPSNWNDEAVPNSSSDITIPSNPSGGNIFPDVNISIANCKSLTIDNGASVNVLSGNTLNIYGDFTNNGFKSG